METLVDELQAGVGLGGRSRTTASPTERARLNVTRAIRTAVQKIAAPTTGRWPTTCAAA
jgi:hypothetical protein